VWEGLSEIDYHAALVIEAFPDPKATQSLYPPTELHLR
jgi:hypothetical protein